MRALLLLALGAPAVLAPAPAPRGLCTAGEQVIFDCGAGRSRIAVCAGTAGVQYRAGRPGRLDLVSPPRSEGLSYANRAYSGGGETQVTFARGRFDPHFSAGVVIAKDGRIVGHRRCTAPPDATLDLTLAQNRLPEGDFVEHD